MILKRTVDPVQEALDLKDVKQWLFIDTDNTDFDSILNMLIDSVTDSVEQITRRALITQTWEYFLDQWPTIRSDVWWSGTLQGAEADVFNYRDFIEVPKPRLQEIVQITTFNKDDEATVWSTDHYFVDTISEPGRVVLKQGSSFPSANLREANAIKIEFKAGYGNTEDDIPSGLKLGMLKMVAHLFENRGDSVEKALSTLDISENFWDYRIFQG